MADPSGPLNGLPAWMKAIAIVGLPGAVAFFLLAQQAGVIPSPAADTKRLVQDHVRDMKVNTHLWRQICRSLANNETDKSECSKTLTDLEGAR